MRYLTILKITNHYFYYRVGLEKDQNMRFSVLAQVWANFYNVMYVYS